MATKQKYSKSKTNKKSAFKKIEEFEDSGFGTYQEDTGGGKPFSTSNTRTTRENGKYRQANNKTNQPRTDDGKFTYKSVNGKSIDPKYGPSRGKTVNPLLTGGQNGIKIEDVEKEFDTQQGGYWDKYKDKWYRKGSTAVGGDRKDRRTKVAGEAIWEVARQRYDEVNKEFGGKIEWDDENKEWVATDEGKESDVWSETKKGRKSEAEKRAATEAYKTGEQSFVKDNNGGIATKKGTTEISGYQQAKKQYNPHWQSNLGAGKGQGHTWVPKMANPTTTTAQWKAQHGTTQPTSGGVSPQPSPVSPSGIAPSQPTPVNVNTAQNVSNITNADYTPKYSDSDLADVKAILKEQGFTDDDIAQFDALSPKEKDAYIDTYFE